MSATEYLVDTNILIYHTQGHPETVDFIRNLIGQQTFNISILTKIEFLGWNRHTPEGFEKCKQLIASANVYPMDDDIADKAVELRREMNIKLADAIIAATALINDLKTVTRNVNDFKSIKRLGVLNPLV